MARLDLGGESPKPLRDYQAQLLDGILREFMGGNRRVLVSLPTGGGKTRVALEIARRAREKGNAVAVLCERIVLCEQWVEKAGEIGLDCGIVQSTNNRLGEDLTSYSQQTIEARLHKLNAVLPEEAIVVVDECHVQRAAITEWIRSLPDERYVVGLTATPHSDGLGDTYEALVPGPTTDQLREQGWLLPERVFAAQAKIDMTGARVGNNGEWVGEEIDEAVRAVVGDVPGEWLRVCEEVLKLEEIPRTIVFSATIASGKMLMDAWNSLGIGEIAGQISCYDTPKERKAALKCFQDGSKPVLINVAIIGRGFDCPEASVLVDASPYRASITAYAQMVGRVLRPATGVAQDGETAYILDHGGNYERFYDQWKRFCRDGVQKLMPDRPEPEDRPASRWVAVWECGECRAQNPMPTETCGEDPGTRGCGAERQPGKNRVMAWRCGICRTINHRMQQECMRSGCAGRQPGSEPGGDDEQTAWKCVCGVLNSLKDTECAQCGLARPQSHREVEGELVEMLPEGKPVGVDLRIDGSVNRNYTWCHLCELSTRHYLQRQKNVTPALAEKARKLAMARYKALFGSWPSYPFHTAREVDVDPRLHAWWRKKQEEFKESVQGNVRRGGPPARPAQAAVTGGYGFSS